MDPISVIENANSRSETDIYVPYIIGSSITGISHKKIELPCQDAYKYEILESGSSIIAISDGLGSAIHSDVGATIAVESVIHFFKQNEHDRKILVDDLPVFFKNAVEFARNELKKKANLEQNSIQSYACTLIVILIIEKTVIVAHIGDGAVIGKTQMGYELISAPEEQEYINEVTPITSTSWEESLKISLPFPEIEYIAAFTDGCQRAILIKNEGVWKTNTLFLEAFFTYLITLQSRSEKEQFLNDIIDSKKFSDISEDDKTLVVAVL